MICSEADQRFSLTSALRPLKMKKSQTNFGSRVSNFNLRGLKQVQKCPSLFEQGIFIAYTLSMNVDEIYQKLKEKGPYGVNLNPNFVFEGPLRLVPGVLYPVTIDYKPRKAKFAASAAGG